MNTTAYRYLGCNDEEDSCCQCGRQGLKRVVWLQPLNDAGEPDGDPAHFGTTCGAWLLLGKISPKKPKKSVAVKELERAAHLERLRYLALFEDQAPTEYQLRDNRWGVACLVLDGRDYPLRTMAYGGGYDTIATLRSARSQWAEVRASEAAKADGHCAREFSPYSFRASRRLARVEVR